MTYTLTPAAAAPGDDVRKRFHGLVGQRLALIAGEEHLNVGGLAVVALRSRRGQRVTPEVLDVLDMLVCPAQLRRRSS